MGLALLIVLALCEIRVTLSLLWLIRIVNMPMLQLDSTFLYNIVSIAQKQMVRYIICFSCYLTG